MSYIWSDPPTEQKTYTPEKTYPISVIFVGVVFWGIILYFTVPMWVIIKSLFGI